MMENWTFGDQARQFLPNTTAVDFYYEFYDVGLKLVKVSSFNLILVYRVGLISLWIQIVATWLYSTWRVPECILPEHLNTQGR